MYANSKFYVRVPPPMEFSEERLLWERWRDGADLAAREQLITHYTPFVRILAARLFGRRHHDAFEYDEYLQFGMVGLMDAMQRFDVALGHMFKTYAATRINGAILSGLDRLSEQQQQRALRRQLRAERVEDLRTFRATQLPPVQLLQYLGEVSIGLALGLLLEGTGMVAEPDATVPNPVYMQLEVRQLQRRLHELLLQLREREQEVLRMHYLHDIAFTDIAQKLSISRGRVSQLHRQGLTRLHALLIALPACDVVW